MKCTNYSKCGVDHYALVNGLCTGCQPRVKLKKIKKKDLPGVKHKKRPCAECGKSFRPQHNNKKRCSDECDVLALTERQRLVTIQNRADRPVLDRIPCALDSCRIMFTPKESKNTFHSKECLKIRANQRQVERRAGLKARGEKVI